MPINLTISADSVQEFDTLLARFARPGAAEAIMPELKVGAATLPATQDAAEPARPSRARKNKDDAGNGSTPAATTAAPGSTPEDSQSQDTAASTGSNGTAVDPFATPGTETVAATPAATSPADTAAAEAGEVTIQQLKDAMADLLKAKSASFAMQTLEAATGCKSLTSGSPSVVEKAKEDPTIFRKTLDALVAAKTAA